MKYLILLLIALLFSSCGDDDDVIGPINIDNNFLVTVENGIGSGEYQVGDTVYIYTRALLGGELLRDWQYNTTNLVFLEDSNEWRTSFIMPATDVMASASIFSIPANFLQFETIQGVNTLKPVYSAFPDNSKGTVFIFHGTGGSAQGWVGDINDQNFTLVKDLFAAGYGVIITESEESTLRRDLNGDGRIRYQSFPVNLTNNVDYQNLEIITDLFETRGDLDRSKLFSIGMSSGGSFSGAFSFVFKTVASAVYGAPSQTLVAENTLASLLYCLMPNDEIVGQVAIDEARLNSETLIGRGICSEVFVSNPFPVYPEYFARVGLTETQSLSIFDELASNGKMDSSQFLTTTLEEVKQNINANPANWNSILSLSIEEQLGVSNLINLAVGGHQFYSEHNQRTIAFFDAECN